MRRAQDQLLRACFGEGEEGRCALEACIALQNAGSGQWDAAARRLLPVLYRRWGATERNGLIDLAHRVYLATWQQNRERMAHLASVLREFDRAGIECMLLKGAALTLRHYRDFGLRTMGDFDLLIHPHDIEAAVRLLLQNGWRAEEGCSTEAILRQSRVRHAWQVLHGETQNCDLHWRPLARCNSPQVAEAFWRASETVGLDGHAVKVPCPTDQLFHVCVHAMHWEWTPNLYWVADALTVLGDAEIDWGRAAGLAAGSNMGTPFTQALATLASEFHYAVPERALAVEVAAWERREYALMQKPCPLGLFDSASWHIHHFRRLRPFDPRWSEVPVWIGFPQYVAAFLDAPDWRTLLAKLWAEVRRRAREKVLFRS